MNKSIKHILMISILLLLIVGVASTASAKLPTSDAMKVKVEFEPISQHIHSQWMGAY